MQHVKLKMSRQILTIIVIVLMIATLVFIWSNSLKSEQVSSVQSGTALGTVQPFLEFFFGKGNVTDHLVRKIAHFTEFGALGCELALLVALRGRPRVQTVTNCLFAGLAAAVTDEALQLISSRGAMVMDVLLDFSGIVTGVAAVLLLYALCNLRRSAQ